MASSIAYTKTNSVFNVKGVNLFLEKNHILRDINLNILDIIRPDVTQGQIVGLLGPSGIGKTQLINCMCGLYNPIENDDPTDFAYMTGEVLISDKQRPVVLGDVGVVQQDYRLYRHRTVQENLLLAGHKLPAADRKSKAEAYMAHFDLIKHREKYPAQLSGGTRQRVAIAMSFLNAENVVLLDEPFSGLDPIMIDRVMQMIVSTANLQEENTILLVSHDVTNTLLISDTIAMLGLERNADGSAIPGATIKPTNIYDLVDLDFAWHNDLRSNVHFAEFALLVRDNFKNLC